MELEIHDIFRAFHKFLEISQKVARMQLLKTLLKIYSKKSKVAIVSKVAQKLF